MAMTSSSFALQVYFFSTGHFTAVCCPGVVLAAIFSLYRSCSQWCSMLEALIFLLEPSYTSLCRGCNIAWGCTVIDGSPVRSTWLYFHKYLFYCWIFLIRQYKYCTLSCGCRLNTVHQWALITQIFCSRCRWFCTVLKMPNLCNSAHLKSFIFNPLEVFTPCLKQK